jgi:fumarylpyruvate hydrolase
MKPADAATTSARIPYPPGTKNYHYETELVLAIGKEGRNISAENTADYIYGYAIGFDMTRRDLQTASGGLGHPWDTGKGFDHSAPVSSIYPASVAGNMENGRITLSVNGELKQDADLSQLIWKSNEIIAQLSRLYLLKPGDLIFTGTPAGVGAVLPGDKLLATIEKLGELSIEITEPE